MQGGQSAPGFRRIEFTAHGADIGDGVSQIFRWQCEGDDFIELWFCLRMNLRLLGQIGVDIDRQFIPLLIPL